MKNMKKVAVAAVTVFALMGTAACGGDSNNNNNTEPPAAQTSSSPVFYDTSQVLAHIGAQGEEGLEFIVTDEGVECETYVVMTTPESVSMYADAGDVVATNPDGTVGIKVTSEEKQTCYDAITERLSTFPDGEPVFDETAAASNESKELRTNVELYSNLFLNGQGAEAYNLFSNRCMARVDINEYTTASEQAKQMYGPMEMESFEAEVSGTMARVTYTYPVPALDQQQEPWVYEDGMWKQDDC